MAGLSLNKLTAEIHKAGASLTVEKGKLGIKGKVSEGLRASIRENQQALTEYLTYDQEAAYKLLRAARAYISERYILGTDLDDDLLEHLIDQAMVQEDMWALRTAIRRWVLAWVKAIGRAPQQHRYLKLEIEKWLEVDRDARVWVSKLPERSERYLKEQLWQVVRELGDRGVLVANKEILAIVLMEAVREIGEEAAA